MRNYYKSAALFLAVSSIAFVQAPVVAESLEKVEQPFVSITNPSLASIVDSPKSPIQPFSVHQNVFESSNLDELAMIITSQAQQYVNEFTVQYTGNTSNLENDLLNIYNQYIMSDDYAFGTVKSFGISSSGFVNDVTITINFEYHNTKEQEEFITQEIKRIANEIIKPSMTDLEKIKAINDYIVLNTTYSYDTTTTPHSAYALLTEGKGVCQAYALTAYRLLKEANLEARYVTGFAGEDHAWNLVKVDGEWYHLDTTWNDPVFTNGKDMSDYVQYDYFLISDKEINKDHTIDDNGYPAATSDRFIAFRTVSSPVTVGDTLYYGNNQDDLKLYKLEMNTSIPQAKKVSNTRVKFLTYANNAFYFSNYSNGAYLYKMAVDGTGETLLVNKEVTKIEKLADELVAYSDNEVIYREAITPPVEEIDLKKVEDFSSKVQQIVFLSAHFRTNAEQLFELYEGLTSKEKTMLSVEVQQKYTLIDQSYKKMLALKFTETIEWDTVRQESNINKPWIIKFNQDVENSPSNLSKIQVVNMFGDKVDVSFEVVGNVVTVLPQSSYVENIVYTLVIPADLKNSNGDTLGQGRHLQFIVKP